MFVGISYQTTIDLLNNNFKSWYSCKVSIWCHIFVNKIWYFSGTKKFKLLSFDSAKRPDTQVKIEAKVIQNFGMHKSL